MSTRLIVAGSRHIRNEPWVAQYLNRITENITIDEVVSGGARGVDTAGEKWAAQAGIPVKRFPAQWSKYGRSAGYRRNEQMAKYATHLVAFWDGESRGTKHMIDLAREHGLEVRVVMHPERLPLGYFYRKE